MLSVGGMALLCVACILGTVRQVRKPLGPVAPTRGFFTTDDGKTTFIGDLDHPVPFVHDGLPAVEAGVFTCDGGAHTWVAYLRNGDLVKRPGSDKWVSQMGPRGDEILNVKCPDRAGRPEPVWP